MNQLNTEKRAQVIRCLCEGMSIRATVRTTGAAKNTVVKLLAEIGKACADYQFETLRNLDSMVVQCDEIWSFVGCKEKQATAEKKAMGQGNAWTWTALDSDSKLIITWHLGGRTDDDAEDFMLDLADRLNRRIQLSTDGLGTYVNAVKLAFGKDVDYGQVVKVFGQDIYEEKRYSPAVCTSCQTKAIVGEPIESQISTSHVERSNLTIRMQNRRMTRLTNAFSKSIENHGHSLALTFMSYNFATPHGTLSKKAGFATTPAMAAGVADHVWTMAEIVGLLDR
ncbi:MAG: IS1 family transposase [Fimbriimonadaceae bacterium]